MMVGLIGDPGLPRAELGPELSPELGPEVWIDRVKEGPAWWTENR